MAKAVSTLPQPSPAAAWYELPGGGLDGHFPAGCFVLVDPAIDPQPGDPVVMGGDDGTATAARAPVPVDKLWGRIVASYRPEA